MDATKIKHNVSIVKFTEPADFPKEHPLVNDTMLARLGFRMTWYGNYNIFYIFNELEDVVHIIRVLYNKQDW